jgi:hypothetical protein
MGKDKKLKGKQPKVDPKGKDPSRDKYVPSAAEIAEDKQARLAVSLEIVRKQTAHPPPVRMALPSASLPLTRLDKEPKKRKDPKERKGSVDKNSPSSESSDEPVLDTSLIREEKEDKKTAEVKPGTSPALSSPNSEDASMLSGLLDENGNNNCEEVSADERSPNNDELLNSITRFDEEETPSARLVNTARTEAKQDDIVSTKANQEENVITAVDLEDYIQVVQNNNTEIRYWYDAKGFPNLTSFDPEVEDIDKYIEDVLAHSHKWKDQCGSG